ncbi:MAG: hypothetical protein U9Q07_12465 [Planctomycetota bacterium]|nr:hypothetical protein [Planctomycetota bacterium]
MFSFPATLIFGIVGIIHDRQKLLAIVTTLVSGGLMLSWAYMVGT